MASSGSLKAEAVLALANFLRKFGAPYEFEELSIGFCPGCGSVTSHPLTRMGIKECVMFVETYGFYPQANGNINLLADRMPLGSLVALNKSLWFRHAVEENKRDIVFPEGTALLLMDFFRAYRRTDQYHIFGLIDGKKMYHILPMSPEKIEESLGMLSDIREVEIG